MSENEASIPYRLLFQSGRACIGTRAVIDIYIF